MAQKTMYSAMVNSPQTKLSAGIDNMQTTIPVVDVSVFPTAPNLATIGLDQNGETILYTGIDTTNSQLTGVTRGFQGTAQAWASGKQIARVFTAYDYDTLVANLNDLGYHSMIATNAPPSNNGWVTIAKIASADFDDSFNAEVTLWSSGALDSTGSPCNPGMCSFKVSPLYLYDLVHTFTGSTGDMAVTGARIVSENGIAYIQLYICDDMGDVYTFNNRYYSAVSNKPITLVDIEPNATTSTPVFSMTMYSTHGAEGHSTVVTGRAGHAEGYFTTAAGDYSHAEGYSSKSSGNYSHAEGYKSLAVNESGHTEGVVSKVNVGSTYSATVVNNTDVFNGSYNTSAGHAEGFDTLVTGVVGHAEGLSSVASGMASHAEGYRVTAAGTAAHAEGFRTTATTDYSHAEGQYAIAMQSDTNASITAYTSTTLTVDTVGTIAVNDVVTVAVQNSLPVTVTITSVDSTNKILGYTGGTANVNWKRVLKKTTGAQYPTHVEGSNTVATGSYSHAEGFLASASGSASHAEGYQTAASGSQAHAEGYKTLASNSYTHAEGYQSTASGQYAHAEGYSAIASGSSSHAEGYFTTASGAQSHAEGGYALASGQYAHAEGYSTTASGNTAHAEGNYGIAIGTFAHVEGNTSVGAGYASHAEGMNNYTGTGYARLTVATTTSATTLTVDNGAAFSVNDQIILVYNFSNVIPTSTNKITITAINGNVLTLANSVSAVCEVGALVLDASKATNAYGAHAEGIGNVASGNYSHVSGLANQARYAQTVVGQFCVLPTGSDTAYVSTNELFIIGNGTGVGARGNAFKVVGSGAVYADAAYNSTGADYAEYFEWTDGNPNGEDRVGYFVALDGEMIRKANSTDDYILGIVSSTPSVVGDGYEAWKYKYITDEWGRIQYHYVDRPEQTQVVHHNAEVDADGNVTKEAYDETIVIAPAGQDYVPMLNPDWDPNMEYVSREHRKEWSAVGMMGKLLVRDDGTCVVNGFCSCNGEGIATKSDKGYRVMKRLGNNQILVLVK